MARKKEITNEKDPNDHIRRKRKPATTPEGRESQMVALAMDVAEERMRNGTASAAEIVHFLKLGSSKERLDQEDKKHDIKLKAAKTEAIQASQRIEELYTQALASMKKYSGQDDSEEEMEDY